MKGYSQDRAYFIDLLTKKYPMEEFILITTPDCVKCKFLKPHVEKWCKENWYTFKEMMYSKGMDDITSVPCAMIGEDTILDYEWILSLITK